MAQRLWKEEAMLQRISMDNVSPHDCVRVSIQANKIILKVLIVWVDNGADLVHVSGSQRHGIFRHQILVPLDGGGSANVFLYFFKQCLLNSDTHCTCTWSFMLIYPSCKNWGLRRQGETHQSATPCYLHSFADV
ncbi:hypothetical protein BS78_05G051700 [Paspalum vaginatum]|nr:hypothetical protein BS78_05G051700 [Paspalum vaginatum]